MINTCANDIIECLYPAYILGKNVFLHRWDKVGLVYAKLDPPPECQTRPNGIVKLDPLDVKLGTIKKN